MPLLHLVQAEDGYLTPAGIGFCAAQLGLTGAEVTAVATFYTMYRRGPTGDYLVGVCTNTLCAVMGGDAIFDALKEHLGIDNDQTTDDGSVTLQHIECNAACDYAPVVMVNWEFFDNQTPSSARELVDALRAGEPRCPPAARRCARSARPRASWPAFPTTARYDGPGRRRSPDGAQLAGCEVAQGRQRHAGTARHRDDDRKTSRRTDRLSTATPLTP